MTQTLEPKIAENIVFLDTAQIAVSLFQPRKHFDQELLDELAGSILKTGLHSPILVRPLATPRNGCRYELVNGERRWRAFQQLEWIQIPAIVREMSDDEVIAATLVIDAGQVPLTDFEAAKQFIALANRYANESESFSHHAIAVRLGCSETKVRHAFKIDSLPAPLKEVSERRTGVMMSLFEIAKLPESERPPLLRLVDNNNPTGFRVIKSKVDEIKERLERHAKVTTTQAPDRQTQQRATAHAEYGGGSMSRGLILTSETPKNAREYAEKALSEIHRASGNLSAWFDELNEADKGIIREQYLMVTRDLNEKMGF